MLLECVKDEVRPEVDLLSLKQVHCNFSSKFNFYNAYMITVFNLNIYVHMIYNVYMIYVIFLVESCPHSDILHFSLEHIYIYTHTGVEREITHS